MLEPVSTQAPEFAIAKRLSMFSFTTSVGPVALTQINAP